MTETEAESNPDTMKDRHGSRATKRILRIVMGVVLAAVVLPPIVVPLCKPPWSEINCQHQDINIKTGQARYSRYLWYVKIWETIRDTPISVALGGEVIDAVDIKPWHRVNTFALGSGYSPNYRFHGTFHQTHDLGMTFQMIELEPEEKREIAENILKLWQTGKGYRSIDDSLQAVLDKRISTTEEE
jgi:hypothetical protein